MPSKDDHSTYEIGFGKPPEHSKFRKGLSGNPKGRPKGRRNLAIVLEQTLQEKIVIREGETRKTVTKLEAAVKQLVDKAAKGDLAALRQLTALAGSAVEQKEDSSTNELDEADMEVMQSVVDRLKGCTKGEGHED
jgi:hypothetical protein